ncbi:MAG: hypothetical protein L6Q57_02810 [Alphaproteobacteria bacterium]|nr:hypothetical protein [Alphaproteobacteria bacterium]
MEIALRIYTDQAGKQHIQPVTARQHFEEIVHILNWQRLPLLLPLPGGP